MPTLRPLMIYRSYSANAELGMFRIPCSGVRTCSKLPCESANVEERVDVGTSKPPFHAARLAAANRITDLGAATWMGC